MSVTENQNQYAFYVLILDTRGVPKEGQKMQLSEDPEPFQDNQNKERLR